MLFRSCRVGQPLSLNRNFISESRPINVRAVNIPMDGHGWPPRRNADCNVYIGPWHPNASSKYFSSILIPSMRLPLLLTSFLVVLPVSLICLSLNLRIVAYISIIQTACSQFISSAPSPAERADKVPIVHQVTLFGGFITYTSCGCRQ